MPGIVGQGTTFNLPNFTGELFNISPTDTPFLSAIGGLTGGRQASATEFEWQAYDMRDARQRTRLEGAAAPAPEHRKRFPVKNVVEIHQETVDISYTKLAAVAALGGLNAGGSNPVADEVAFQVEIALKQIARDIEYSFLRGKYVLPVDNTTARQTRGLIQATTTNVIDLRVGTVACIGTAASDLLTTASAHGYSVNDAVMVIGVTDASGLEDEGTYYVQATPGATTLKLALAPGGAPIDLLADFTGGTIAKMLDLTEDHLLNLLQMTWKNGGIQEQDTATVMVNGTLKRRLTKIFVTDKDYSEQSRNMGGVSVSTIETDFGRLNVMAHRIMPPARVQVASLEQCAPRVLQIPEKGFLFVEPLSKTGASDASQMYGEIGLEYGNQNCHGQIIGAK